MRRFGLLAGLVGLVCAGQAFTQPAVPAVGSPPGTYQFCDPNTDSFCVPLRITPSSGLTDGQRVQVLSTGNVLPSTTYQVEECKGIFGVQNYPATDCDPSTLVIVTTPATANSDSSGTLSTEFTVHQNIIVSTTAINCSFAPCVIAVVDVPQYNPINFGTSGGGGNSTQTTATDFAACPNVTSTIRPGPGPGPEQFNCGSPVTTPGEVNRPNNNDPGSSLGCFPSSANPLGVWIHVQTQFGGGIGGTADISVTGPVSFTTSATWADQDGSVLQPFGRTLPAGMYTVTVTFETKIVTHPDGSTETDLSSSNFGTLQVDCPPPPAYPAFGAFVIGDGNAVVGNQVYFWGSQWAKNNSVSGGSAPSAFKGFEGSTQPDRRISGSCGGFKWTADPGNSGDPPTTVPPLMIVVVTSKVTKSGSNINGDVVHLAVVKVDPGYQSNPGHAGTGQVLGTC